ncbi:nucleoid occlusion factor SlmA [Marinomonas mediterranea]|jgi:cell division inhibitor SlmA|uniref:Nucleoid occlusion factor SlmA n=1 Tax=Marinomonas mediterranea (strain ATCC 700492 / JCM 21426 / NBRC 103028 / MMB-1) TaxID=717774 RepID=F2K087_MARM1|nr:nucleoid occlusion factor SlmA [Marinomonas mediterranea]ADZ89802.1 regulatory protein TetR [Marinomonas mediterranea MMB-1]WCN07891.1 nucleoid occlusion factor SlmA [Marinomonas mediterranea]WCN11986.1 nucleoid occlusion factor SlmA [Marinomonas mediterranea]WCN16023.1 nucleoid occlusion factor SlmA [Marinomonas mediterranea MMB-1]
MTNKKPDRRTQILQALAAMLESSPGARITTAALAKQVGVSEAALYRHFPSKAKMFEGLIEFIEESLFSRITRIIQEESDVVKRTEMILTLVLGFSDHNPGMCRLLTGDALAGETERLRVRIAQLFDRIETQLKQIIREADLKQGLRPTMGVAPCANFLVSLLEGKIRQYVRSEFKSKPLSMWKDQWNVLAQNLMVSR